MAERERAKKWKRKMKMMEKWHQKGMGYEDGGCKSAGMK